MERDVEAKKAIFNASNFQKISLVPFDKEKSRKSITFVISMLSSPCAALYSF